MEKEKYKPTPGEVEKAEEMAVEGEMTPEQERMSRERSETFEAKRRELASDLYDLVDSKFNVMRDKALDSISNLCKEMSSERFRQLFLEEISMELLREWDRTIYGLTKKYQNFITYGGVNRKPKLLAEIRKEMLSGTIEKWLENVLPILNKLNIPKDILDRVVIEKIKTRKGTYELIIDRIMERNKMYRELAIDGDATYIGEEQYDIYDFDLREMAETIFKEKINEIMEKE